MPRLWVGNFDFEHRLADPGWSPSARLKRLNAELAACWIAIAAPDDVLWTPEPIAVDDWPALNTFGLTGLARVADWRTAGREYELTPWGWTPEFLQAAARRQPGCSLPTADAVRWANSRRTSFGWETDWQVGLPGQACCGSLDEVAEHLQQFPADQAWVIKTEFGMSGRERLLGQGVLTPIAGDWLRRRFRKSLHVFLEPWVERIAEAGILFDVPARGHPAVVGVSEMCPGIRGQYAGSVFYGSLTSIDWSPAVAVAERAAYELQRRGYMGPLGIDAMCYRGPDGEPMLRPLQDINARWTMGRLAWGWRQRVPEVATGLWHHGPIPENHWPPGRVITTSPRHVGSQAPAHGTNLLLTDVVSI